MRFVSFSHARVYPMLINNSYHGGDHASNNGAENQRGLITDNTGPPDNLSNTPQSIRTWKLSAKLTAAALAAFKTFYESHNGGLTPFYYYDCYEVTSGPIGGNFDPTGASITGRFTVVFTNNVWAETVSIGRTVVQFELKEVA